MDKALILAGLATVVLALGFYFLLPLQTGPDPYTGEARGFTLYNYRALCSDHAIYSLAEERCEQMNTYAWIVLAATGLGCAMFFSGFVKG